jgi:hypothetical protein
MPKVLLTVQLPSDRATVDGARSKLGLTGEELDAAYGVVPIDPDHDLYAVMVEEDAASRASAEGLAGGPFSNPTIEPFGPPRTGGDRRAPEPEQDSGPR